MDQFNSEDFARKWAEVTVDRLHQALDKFDIGKLDGELWKSIVSEVVANNGDVEKVITKFLTYGRFVDMGVGRGVPIGGAGTSQFSAARNDDGTLKQYRRRPKPWYSRTYYSEVQRFAELYARDKGESISLDIADRLDFDLNQAV